MFVFLCFCFLNQPPIPLPEGCSNLGEIVFLEDGLVVFERDLVKLFRLDDQGRVLRTFGKKGAGPGEVNRPSSLMVAKGKLYWTDLFQRKVVVLDLDLNFVEEIRLQEMTRAYCPLGPESVLTVSYDPIGNHLLKLEQGERTFRFGKGLPLKDAGAARQLMGSQSGEFDRDGETLWFIHHFWPVLYRFDHEGKQMMEVPLPFELPEMVASFGDLPVMVKGLVVGEAAVYVRCFDMKNRAFVVFEVNKSTGTVNKMTDPGPLYSDEQGRIHFLMLDEDGEAKAVCRFQGLPSDSP